MICDRRVKLKIYKMVATRRDRIRNEYVRGRAEMV